MKSCYRLVMHVVFVCCSVASYAQWEPIGPTTSLLYRIAVADDKLFVGGLFSGGGLSNLGLYYDGLQFQYLSLPGFSGSAPRCFLERQNNTVLAGGGFVGQFGSPFGVAQWDGELNWVSTPYDVGNPLPVMAMLEHNGLLYVAGQFTDPEARIAVHDGTGYGPVGAGFDEEVNDLIIYDGALYAAGAFTMSGTTPVEHIARWTGSTWVDVGGGLNNDVYDLEVYNGELYATGIFSQAGGAPVARLAKWNGTSWSAVGGGITTQFNAAPKAMCATSSGLYVGGRMMTGGAVPLQGVGVWNGTTWINPGNLPSYYFEVSGIAEFQGMVYLATTDVSTSPLPTSRLYRTSAAISVAEISMARLSVGPNPAQDRIAVLGATVNGSGYAVLDVHGKLVASGTYRDAIDITDLGPGAYSLRIDGTIHGYARFVKL